MRRRRLLPVYVVSHLRDWCDICGSWDGSWGKERVGTNHCAGDTEALEFLAVVCARLCAVICHEDYLFACSGRQYSLP
jgi:hypothetical protein